MKGYVALIILVVATTISTLLFYRNHSSKQPLCDKLDSGLTKIKQYTPLSATIYYDSNNVDGEIFSVARYVLSPRNLIVAKQDIIADTLLSISKDSTVSVDHTSRNIILEYKQGQLYYILSVNE